MNWDDLKGDWKSNRQRNSKWDKLTADDFKQISRKRDELADKLQNQYGQTREEADRQIEAFTRGIKGKQ